MSERSTCRGNAGRGSAEPAKVGKATTAVLWIAGLLAVLGGLEPLAVVVAQDPYAQSDDPLDLSQWAQEVGPTRILGFLEADHPPLLQLRAIRAVHALSQREHALRALLPFVQGHDPDLAPAAARAALQIARACTDDVGLRGEVDLDALRGLQRDYETTAQELTLRADLSLIAIQVAAQLAETLGVAPASTEGTVDGPG